MYRYVCIDINNTYIYTIIVPTLSISEGGGRKKSPAEHLGGGTNTFYYQIILKIPYLRLNITKKNLSPVPSMMSEILFFRKPWFGSELMVAGQH